MAGTKVMTVGMAVNGRIGDVFYRVKIDGLSMDVEGEMWEALRSPARFWNEQQDGQRCRYQEVKHRKKNRFRREDQGFSF